jgi:uncharacterized protein (UPF0210 family)
MDGPLNKAIAMSNVVNESNGYKPNLLALLIMEMRTANELAKKQNKTLDKIADELEQTRYVILRVGQGLGSNVSR